MTRKSKKQFQNQSQAEYMKNNEPQIAGGEVGKQNRIKIHSQDGRSMIEMLGVLAIIAILSIGGIVGYKLAMNYYQADQIANEINLMRTDLKVKYALGNEELLLGDPYDETPDDEHYSGHLSTQYDRYPVDYDCIRKDKAEFYNCRETDAYYIKVGNVSKGVCKPLTTLLNGMDGLMYMEINKQPYKEDDLCSSDENNEIYIEFDAEEVNGNYDSNRPEGWCAKDEDCEEPQVCDKENNMCVECVKDDDCNAPRSVCDVENNECVECTENADCPINKPVCNVEQGNCESCPPEKPLWDGTQCVECKTDEDCLAKGTENPICNEENTCKPCPDGQQWKESAHGCVAYECRTNKDCNPEGGFEKYCYLAAGASGKAGASGTSEWQDDDPNGENYSGECHYVSDDLLKKEPTNIQNIKFYGSNKQMNWWTSCRFCAAHAKQSDEGCVGTTEGPSFMAAYRDINWQCSNDEFAGNGRYYYCKGTDVNLGSYNVSPTIKEFRKMFDNDENYTGVRWVWLREALGSRYRGIELSVAQLDLDPMRYSSREVDRALCRE